MTKKRLFKIIKEWKANQKIIDYTDQGLIKLAAWIIDYEGKRGKLR